MNTPNFDALADDLRELRADIEAHGARLRGENPAREEHRQAAESSSPTPTPAVGDDPAKVIKTALESVRARRFSAAQDRAQVEAGLADNTMFSADYKREQADNFRAVQAQEAEAVAALAWRRVEAMEADLRAQVTEAERQVDARVDHARVAGMTKEIEARLAVGVAPSGLGARLDEVAQAEKIIAEAEASGDPDRLRATRHALADLATRLATTGAGHDAIRGRALRARLRELEGIERADADRLAAVLGAVGTRKAELAHEISLLESEVTGAKRSMFMPVTGWDASVFGKQAQGVTPGKADALEGMGAALARAASLTP